MPIINTPIVKSLKEEFKPYAQEVILNNLPMIDGLLLSHKKVLWGMFKKHTFPDKPFVKNIKNQGAIVEYYVYGDMPLAKVMVNMANNGVNIPYLEWDGNSGDKFRKEGKPASARYTGSRMSKYGVFMLQGIEKNAVSMKPNYDNTSEEPIIAPSIAPNLLLNNSESIAISEASKIPPHNVKDTCDSIIDYIENQDIDKAINILKCPDFCNNSKIIYDKKDFEKIYKEGRGSFSLVGRYIFDKKTNILSIIEVPFTTTIDAIESAILDKISKKNLFKEVADTRNASGKDGLKLDIYLKKNTDIDFFEKQLRKYTPFESKYSCNFTILGLDLVPYLMNLEGVYTTWISHRINCIKNETQYEINTNKTELNKLYGLQTINSDLDKAIEIIRKSKTEKNAAESLIKYFKLNEKQAEYIATIRLLNINQEWIFNKIQNITSIENKNIELNDYYNSESKIKETIISQLEDFKKKYGRERLTEIIYPDDNIQDISKEDLIDDHAVTICLSKEGYIKKNLKYSESQKLKENDEILQLHQTTNKTDLLLFTDKARLFTRKTYDIEEKTPSQIGEFLPNIIDLLPDEKVIHITTTKDWNENLICAFENGNVSKMSLLKSKPQQNRKVAIDKIYNTESPLKSIIATKKDVDILLLTQSGHCLIVDSQPMNAVKSKNGLGVVGISLDIENMADDKVIGSLMNVTKDTSFTFKTEKGKEVYILLDDVCPVNDKKNIYDHHKGKRGRMGNMIFNCRQKNDKIIELIK